MANSKWVYRLADGIFLRGCFCDHPFDSSVEGVVEFLDSDAPDPRTQRFDSVKGKRAATAQELITFDDSQSDDRAKSEVDGKTIKAALLAIYWQVLGTRPTPVQIQALRTKFITVYKELQ